MSDTAYFSRAQRSISTLEQEILDLQKEMEEGVEAEAEVIEEQVAALQKEQAPEADKPLTKEEETFKKRYGDLRAHSQRVENDLKKRIAELEKAVGSGGKTEVAPKTPEEVKAWMAKYPDVAGIVLSLIEDRAGTKNSELDSRLRQIEEKEEAFKKEAAIAQLKKLHPDFDALVKPDSPLHDWAAEQPEWVQNILYDGDDPKAVGRVLDMYKIDIGEVKPKARQSDAQKAAKAVVTSPNGAKPAENSGKRVFRESEINRMSIQEFEAMEKEILAAQREGRVVKDLRGAAY